MEQLLQQYKRFRTLLLGLAITCQYFVMRFVIDAGLLGEKTPVQFFLTLSVVYSSLVLLPLLAYERFAWRWFNKRLNISGRWYYHLRYHPAEGREDLVAGLPQDGAVQVRQTPFVVCFESGVERYGPPGRQHLVSWGSTSCDFTGDTRLHMTVELVVDTNHYFGVERVNIHQDEKRRPNEMHSDFFLYGEDHVPLAHGEVYYARTKASDTASSAAERAKGDGTPSSSE